jgi:hypothetical protein
VGSARLLGCLYRYNLIIISFDILTSITVQIVILLEVFEADTNVSQKHTASTFSTEMWEPALCSSEGGDNVD